jgi:2-iminobutanoate/2-iminopropanoate deaminase
MSEKHVVRTEAAPAPFQGAPYSQAIAAGGFVFVSGQLGLKPGDTAISGRIEEQTEQVFANLKAKLPSGALVEIEAVALL